MTLDKLTSNPDASELGSLRSTLFLVLKGLSEQAKISSFGNILLRVLKQELGPEETALLEQDDALKDISQSLQKIALHEIRRYGSIEYHLIRRLCAKQPFNSQYPAGWYNILDNHDARRLKNLAKHRAAEIEAVPELTEMSSE